LPIWLLKAAKWVSIDFPIMLVKFLGGLLIDALKFTFISLPIWLLKAAKWVSIDFPIMLVKFLGGLLIDALKFTFITLPKYLLSGLVWVGKKITDIVLFVPRLIINFLDNTIGALLDSVESWFQEKWDWFKTSWIGSVFFKQDKKDNNEEKKNSSNNTISEDVNNSLNKNKKSDEIENNNNIKNNNIATDILKNQQVTNSNLNQTTKSEINLSPTQGINGNLTTLTTTNIQNSGNTIPPLALSRKPKILLANQKQNVIPVDFQNKENKIISDKNIDKNSQELLNINNIVKATGELVGKSSIINLNPNNVTGKNITTGEVGGLATQQLNNITNPSDLLNASVSNKIAMTNPQAVNELNENSSLNQILIQLVSLMKEDQDFKAKFLELMQSNEEFRDYIMNYVLNGLRGKTTDDTQSVISMMGIGLL
jgi:hypothetical protein